MRKQVNLLRYFVDRSSWANSIVSFFLALLALGGVCGDAQAQSATEPIVLTLNHSDTPSGARHIAAEAFAQKVEEFTSGRYRVLVFHSAQLGNDPQSVKAVAEGRLDFTTSATGSFASLVNELNLTALPYLVDSYEQGWRFYDRSPWLARQFGKLPGKGVHYLATWEAGFRSFSTKSALRVPGDAKGKKMRIFPNDMIRWIMESIGYDPVVLPVNAVYAAIQEGKVDGQENPIDTIRSMRFYEVAKNIVLTKHVYSPIPFVMSERTWGSLTAADQTLFLRAAQEAGALSRTLVKEADAANLASMQAEGATIVYPDTSQFKQAMQSVYQRARAVYGDDVDAIQHDAFGVK